MPSESAHLTVKALVSLANSEDMLVAQVMLAGKQETAHFDTCATHCFVSKRFARRLAQRGHEEQRASVVFDVSQGNPLCSTRSILYMRLSIVREDGRVCTWLQCLFIVADAGADLIIAKAILDKGDIVKYRPPADYVHLLQDCERANPTPQPNRDQDASNPHRTVRTVTSYAEPDRISPEEGPLKGTQNLRITKDDTSINNHEKFLNLDLSLVTEANVSTNSKEREPIFLPVLHETVEPAKGTHIPPGWSECLDRSKEPKEFAAALNTAVKEPTPMVKKKKGSTEMLTEALPYGRNPPLPNEVLEAIQHLKNLSDPKTTPVYTKSQLDEVTIQLSVKRPIWSSCLTLKDTEEIANPETAQFLNDLMDKPVFQKSIFSLCMKTPCDLKEYTLPQKPGEDTWNPPQPRNYKSPRMRSVVDVWLDFLLDNDKAEPSRATHPAPITVVEKEGRDERVCLDYRNRNARSYVPAFPMPDVHEFLDDLEGFKYYCSFDMAKMFNQFILKESDRHLAAFITHRGVFEPKVVMFGLAGGPQHAVREVGGAMASDPLTNGIDFTIWAKVQNAKGQDPPYEICPSLGIVPGSRLKPFIDDVTIPSNHKEGMIKLVELFFEFCDKHHLILSRKKSKLMRRYLQMLGFVVSEEGKHLDPKRIIALLEANVPRSKETLHALISSYTFVRMFIPNFATIAAPLYEATKGIVWKGKLSGKAQGIKFVDPAFVWTPEMTRAYDQLRAALLTAPILVKVNWLFALFLSVDASIRGEGWVLWQLITLLDGTKIAVAILYGSRKYNSSEQNWETTRQEASAIRSALTDISDYVFGQHFYLFSDHLNLRFMHNSVNRAVLRMRDFLAQFNMTVIHCPGIWNNADSLSRIEMERLPTEEAQSLNSSTEAKLTGTMLLVSQGTDTSEDSSLENVKELIPFTNPGIHPRVLCTKANNTCENCFLCQFVNQPSYDLTYVEEELAPAPVQCFSTQTTTHESVMEWGLEYEGLIIQCARSFETLYESSTPWQTLKQEAELWNRQLHHRQSSNAQLHATDSPIDQDDIDNVAWCEDINRSTVTILQTSARSNKKLNRIKYDSQSLLQKSDSPKTVLFNVKPSTVPMGEGILDELQDPSGPTEIIPNANIVYDILPQNRIIEVKNNGTQTTAADFRISTIRFPLMADFHSIHNNESGHHGLDFSWRKLLKHCGSKWANERGAATRIREELKQFIDSCPICQKVRGLKDKVKAKHSFIISRPFLEVSYDFIIFTKADKNGNRYMLVAICNFLKLVEIKPVPTRDSETVARFLLEIDARYGNMIRLRSDREGAFCGMLITKLNQARGTEATPCVAYHPQANSICERQNAIIMNHLTSLILGCKLGPDSKNSWSDLIPFVFTLVNTTPKNPLGISPLCMVYGIFANYDPQLLHITPQANLLGSESNPQDYVDSLMDWQRKLLDLAEQIQSDHFTSLDAKLNDVDATHRAFHEGDLVLHFKTAQGYFGKPSSRWLGPFLVLDRKFNDPTHPVLDIMNLKDMSVREASIEDCRQFNTAWFDEGTMLTELIKLSATDDNEYVVERIVSHKPLGCKRTLPISQYFFEVKWQDFPDTTWEPYLSLKDLQPLEDYFDLNPGIKPKKK